MMRSMTRIQRLRARSPPRAAGFCDHVDQFDAAFFGMSPREADGMDPQQRMLLEVCWETLENAGLAPDRLHSSPTGVYVGAAGSDYAYLQLKKAASDRSMRILPPALRIACCPGACRICSGCRVRASRSTRRARRRSSRFIWPAKRLRARECRMALAGGVNLILSPDIFIALVACADAGAGRTLQDVRCSSRWLRAAARAARWWRSSD